MVDEHSTNGAAAGNGSPNGDSIARLVRLAGPRPAIPADVQDRVHASVRKEWRHTVTRRRALRWTVPAALAASMVLAVVLGGKLPLIDGAPVATVAVADVEAGLQGNPLSAGDRVYAGDSIVTGGRGIALAFDNGLSLRLAAGTTTRVDAIDEVTLVEGRIYADTGPSSRSDRAIAVHTEVGSAFDRGTQFAVAYESDAMAVAVREGSVDVSARAASYTADAGQKLTLEPGREAVIETMPPHDRYWDWATALAPAFDIDDRPVAEFLNWAARETGRELVFASDSARLAAMATRLSGSVSGLTPEEAIEAVQPTVPRFDIRIEGRRIIVSLSR